MNKLGPTVAATAQARFAAPAQAQPQPAANAVAPASPPPPVSPELLELALSESDFHKVVVHKALVRLRREIAARKARASAHVESSERWSGPCGVTTFAYAGQEQSSQQDGGDDEGGRRGQAPLRGTPDGERTGMQLPERNTAPAATHIAQHAAGLQQRCEAEHGARGAGAMLAYLHREMQPLLVGCVRDIADKVEWTSAHHHKGDLPAAGPVNEICAALLDLVRPLFGLYAQGPQLLLDVKDVLCGAQDLLTAEVHARSQTSPAFGRLMVETVQPLFAVILLGAMPRPCQDLPEAAMPEPVA